MGNRLKNKNYRGRIQGPIADTKFSCLTNILHGQLSRNNKGFSLYENPNLKTSEDIFTEAGVSFRMK